jgi:hypothetical protein
VWQWHQAEAARQQAEEARREVAQLQYLRQVDLAYRDWKEADVGRARELLLACDPALRHWEWHYVDRLCHAYLREFTGHGGFVYSVCFSPDGQRLATASGGVVRVLDGTPRQ